MADERFGHRMRSERERRRVALESIAARTKIGIGLLRDLERDQLSRWPTGIFRRAFVRSYAEAIGLDPDETLRAFLEEHGEAERPPLRARNSGAQVEAAATVARLASVPRRPTRAQPPLRLTLADMPRGFSGGPVLVSVARRLAAAACDAAMMLGIAGLVSVGLDRFWAPLGVIVFCYQVGSILTLGNTPGVYLFAPWSRGAEKLKATEPSGESEREASDLPASSIFEPRATART
jgi:transcriptional regulator with XRE-family HTH domain